jgi:DNA-binding transcriptional regulator YdaS (Cro superfamily)
MKLVDFARLVGIDKATASRWSASRIPAERVLEVEAATGIGRADLRPDLYPAAAKPAPISCHAS